MKQTFLSILLMLLPLLASAETVEINGIWYNLVAKVKEAEVTSNLNKYSGSVEIPETVTKDGIEYKVTSIGSGAFLESDLTSITIPNSVTSIGNLAFYNCDGLTSVHVSDIESWCRISFKKNEYMGYWGQNPLLYAEHLYIDGEEIKDLIIPSSITSINNCAFYGCSGLTSVTIPNSVISIGESAFYGCSGLTSIAIPTSVTSIGYEAFCGCRGLTSLTIPSSVTSIEGNTFSGCSGLTSITIPNNVTSIGISAFRGCSGLTSIAIPNSVTSIGSDAFSGCSSLTTVTIPNSVTSIGSSAFSRCSGLTSITIPNNVTSIGESAFRGCSGLASIVIPNGVTSIGSQAFYGCSGLTSVIIGNGITIIGEYAFASCQELTNITCLAEKLRTETWYSEGLYTYTNTFEGSFIEYAMLHVSADAIETYKATEPWNGFKNIVPVGEGDIPEIPTMPKCATPTINLVDGEIMFGCETEGTEFVSEVTVSDAKAYYDNKVSAPKKFKVTVHATKIGYDDSDEVTEEFDFSGDTSRSGDVDGNGAVNVADHVKLSKIILNQQGSE